MRAAVQIVNRYDVVARGEDRTRAVRSRHARSESARETRIFETRELRLEGPPVGLPERE
jgi:hypothetical protein